MQYALLIYENENDAYPAGENDPAWRDILNAHETFGGALHDAGILEGGAGLKSAQTATTVRVTKGTYTVHDGPFAETREQLGGLYLINVPDLDAAIEWAKRLPIVGSGSVEIRPVLPSPPQPGA